MKLRLTKIKNGNNLRTDSVEGKGTLPRIGEPLVIISKPLDVTKNFRMVRTSPIQYIENTESGWIITTEFSTYRVERI